MEEEFPRGPGGGSIDEGARFKHAWSYFNNPYDTVQETGRLWLYSGDESVYEEALDTTAAADSKQLTDPQSGGTHDYTQPFSDTPDNVLTATHPSKKVWKHVLDQSGRGITLEYEFTGVNPSFRWYGYTLWTLPGKAYQAPLGVDATTEF